MSDDPDLSRIESIFIRQRNVLMVKAQFTDIFTDHYLHLADQDLRYPPELDLKLKELYAAIVLHSVARPWSETHAWTVSLRAPRVNFFVTASSRNESVVGRAFTEDVREPPQNLLYSQITDGSREPRRSTVALDTASPQTWVEHYYQQSEQRPAKFFELDDENFVLLAAQPDYDEEWLHALDAQAAAEIMTKEEISPLENRFFKFHCGCNLERILPALSAWKNKIDELFQGSPFIKIQCPRCAAKYQVTPADLQSFE